MPAGSPAVSSRRGRVMTEPPRGGGAERPGARSGRHVLDVGFVAQPAQPQLGFLVGLALAQRGERSLAARVVALVVGAPAEQLFERFGIPCLDTTGCSIEEISSRVLDRMGIPRRVRP